jgi:hypothetical protein
MMAQLLLLLFLFLASTVNAATFYVNNKCGTNGNGTTTTCGASGPWNSIKNAVQVADCAGMSPGDTLEIIGDAVKDVTCENGGVCYHEDNINIEGACTGLTVQNAANTHVILDGTVNIQPSTWTSIGSGVYRCATSGCSGDVGDAFAFRAWYDSGSGEQELDLIQTNTACNTSLPAGKMKIDQTDQSICVHLADGTSPAAAEYFRVPWYDPAWQAGADSSDNMTFRKNPVGIGSFRVQRYRKRGIESNAASNTGWTIDGLEWYAFMDRCIAYASGTEGVGNVVIKNNWVSVCGQEGIRLESDAGNWVIQENTISEIQTEPYFERCAGIGTGCLSEFTDNGTGIRIINHQGSSGLVKWNKIVHLGGGMNNRARGINFEHDNNNIIVENNYIAHMSGLVNTGAAIMWSGSFNSDTNDEINVRNNLIYDVDRCFWIQYGTDYDTQVGTINYIFNNTCAEFRDWGLLAQWSGSAQLDGPFHVKNNVFSAQNVTPAGILSVPSTGSGGWVTLQNNMFECDGCTGNQDIIDWRGVIYERDEDCTGGVDCIGNMATLSGAAYTGNNYGSMNVNISGGADPDLRINLPSEADNAGQNLGALNPTDFTGATRPSTYDAGGYNITGDAPPPVTGSIDIAVRRFALNTATGTQTFTFPDFTKSCTTQECAAIFIVTDGISDETNADDAMLSLGFTDGLTSVATEVHDNDAAAPTDTARRSSTTSLIITEDAAGLDGLATFSAWQPAGVTIDITDAFPAAFLVTVVLMGGEGLQADVGTFASNATLDGTTDVTTVGFEADAVLFSSARLTGTSANTYIFTAGAAVNDGSNTQGSIGCFSQHGVAPPTPTNLHANTSTTYATSITDEGGLDVGLQIGTWDSQGFTATSKRVGSGANYHYLALNFGGANSTIIDMDTPTTTGQANYATGFQPLFGMVFGTQARAYDADEADNDAGGCMIGAFTGNNQYTMSNSMDDDLTTGSNTSSSSADQFPIMRFDDGTCVAGNCARGVTSISSTGFSINYSLVFGDNPRKWIGFAVEETAGGGGGGGGGFTGRRGATLLQ